MRPLLLLLILANLLLFAFGQGYFVARHEGDEPERMSRQLNADRLRVLNGPEGRPSPATQTPATP